MNELYRFVTGPLAWIAFLVFVAGSLVRIGHMLYLVRKKEAFIFSYFSITYGLRSIVNWLIPYGPVNMRRHAVLTAVTFIFHLALIFTPIFLLSHVVLWDENWNVSYWSLPDIIADILTVVVIACCVFFWIRRMTQAEVRFLTSASDYVILLLVAAPFVTGFLAYHQVSGYPLFSILHVLTGELMLVIIPFTRLTHMLFFPFTRAYTGSEFGAVRHARDW
jgi:nitrate reductase gamma subunit